MTATEEGSSNVYDVTAITGTTNGQTITGLLGIGTFDNNDNKLYYPGNFFGLLDFDQLGISYTIGTGGNVTDGLAIVGSGPAFEYRTVAVASASLTVTLWALLYSPAPGVAVGAGGAIVSFGSVRFVPPTITPPTVYVPVAVSVPSVSAATLAAGIVTDHVQSKPDCYLRRIR